MTTSLMVTWTFLNAHSAYAHWWKSLRNTLACLSVLCFAAMGITNSQKPPFVAMHGIFAGLSGVFMVGFTSLYAYETSETSETSDPRIDDWKLIIFKFLVAFGVEKLCKVLAVGLARSSFDLNATYTWKQIILIIMSSLGQWFQLNYMCWLTQYATFST